MLRHRALTRAILGDEPLTELLAGVTDEQQGELRAILDRLAQLWSELTIAALNQDQRRVEEIQAEIAVCRTRVEQIKRTGTLGSA
jgi:muramidase (phage lysozyme)